jgi:hypothetical protein
MDVRFCLGDHRELPSIMLTGVQRVPDLCQGYLGDRVP